MIEVKSPPRLPPFPTTIKEIAHRAEKHGRYFGTQFYYCEVDNNFLTLFRVKMKPDRREMETKDQVLIAELKRPSTDRFDSYGGKIDLCEFVLDFSKKKDYYNKKYYRMY